MRKILILEDMEQTRKKLVEIVKRVDNDAEIFAVATVEEAYVIAMKKTIHLFILDIILKPKERYRDSSGADFAQNIRTVEKYHFTPIIFLTSLYDEKLTMYSHVHCYKFIEKPCDYNEVEKTIRDVLTFPISAHDNAKYFYRCGGVLEAIDVKDLIYAESIEHNLHVMTIREEKIIPYKPLKQFRKEIDSDKFLQCNRSTIVNIDYIASIDAVNRFIHLKDCKQVLEIGPILKKKFIEEFKHFQKYIKG